MQLWIKTRVESCPKVKPQPHTLFFVMVYTSPTKVARIAEYKLAGQTDTEIAAKFGIHRTTVPRIFSRYLETKDPYHVKPKSGRPLKLSERDARHAAILLAKTEVKTATELSKKTFHDASRHTIARALHHYGLVVRVRRTKPFISKANIIKRRHWADDHVDWVEEDWARVIFSDESKFQLFKSDGVQWAWFRPGQALDPRFTKKVVKHGGGNIMVWGCITSRGMGQLHKIDGIMCGPDYVKILQKNLPATLRKHKLKKTGKDAVIFQQDNDPKHTSRVAKEWFEAKKFKVLPWPPSSPDMNIIEHVWDQLDHLVRARNPLPRNKDEMWAALQEEWYNFPKERLDKLYESLPRRVAALKTAKGGHTKY